MCSTQHSQHGKLDIFLLNPVKPTKVTIQEKVGVRTLLLLKSSLLALFTCVRVAHSVQLARERAALLGENRSYS